ncbi:MAG TPA: GNAT family N-acetyltransferase [Gemmatimonadales bacterium]|jgi:CelD/BcsL family acetyltransferase involved in cellulose biosynthesis|nr:GNAT family N-acetyltransferase [Gemmatimonadales bacterium]
MSGVRASTLVPPQPTAVPHAASAEAVRVPLAEAVALGPGVWDGLLAEGEGSSPFMTWAWHRAWTTAAAQEDVAASQAVVLRSTTGELDALFPFRLHRTRFRGAPVSALGWAIGDLGCPDHLDLPASRAADLDALVAALKDVPWEIIRLGSVAERAPHMERFCAACVRQGWRVQRAPLWPCPYLDLPETWEAYLSTLSPHGRHAIRRKERKLWKEHAVVLTDYGGGRLDEGLEHLQRLHTLRWDGGGVFRDPGVERLHRAFATALAERDQLWLSTLDVDGAPAAAWYGFSLGDTVYHYQCGRDPRWERDRVGTVLQGLMIRRAIERGYRRLDFLRGEEAYKAEWTLTSRRCYEVVVFRPDWRGVVLRGLDWIAHHPLTQRLRGKRGVRM